MSGIDNTVHLTRIQTTDRQVQQDKHKSAVLPQSVRRETLRPSWYYREMFDTGFPIVTIASSRYNRRNWGCMCGYLFAHHVTDGTRSPDRHFGSETTLPEDSSLLNDVPCICGASHARIRWSYSKITCLLQAATFAAKHHRFGRLSIC